MVACSVLESVLDGLRIELYKPPLASARGTDFAAAVSQNRGRTGSRPRLVVLGPGLRAPKAVVTYMTAILLNREGLFGHPTGGVKVKCFEGVG